MEAQQFIKLNLIPERKLQNANTGVNATNITEMKYVRFRAVSLNPAESATQPFADILKKMVFVCLDKDVPMFMLRW